MSKWIATFFGIGLIPVAPGTFGALAALPGWWALTIIGGWPLVLLGVIVAYVSGVWATGIETAGAANHDPSEIVIDEVAGQWLALLPISVGLGVGGLSGVVLAFALFRFFDITKLGPVGWADRLDTPTGVMLDDIFAGLISAIILTLIGFIWSNV